MQDDGYSDMHNSSSALIQKSNTTNKDKRLDSKRKSTASLGKQSRHGSDENPSGKDKLMSKEQAKNAFASRDNKIGGIYNDNSDHDDEKYDFTP